jgi:hypothetical protein
MNQLELNKIAMNFIRHQSIEVAAKLRDLLCADAEEKSEQMAGPALHYVHSMALFDCLTLICNFFVAENDSREAREEYFELTEALRPRFSDIMESLKDFRPPEDS